MANEVEIVLNKSGHAVFDPGQTHEMVDTLRHDHPTFLISTSQRGANPESGKGMPPATLVETVDYLLPHGNGNSASRLVTVIETIQAMPQYRQNPKPILINEDSVGVPNLDVAWPRGVSWGYYDQGWEGQGDDPYEWYEPLPRRSDHPFGELNGFQTPPVNWMINTPFKRAFFTRVAEITGYPGNT